MQKFLSGFQFSGVTGAAPTTVSPGMLFGNLILFGTRAGHDNLAGLFGDDQIFGFAGNDTLSGNRGDDRLYAGAGNDLAYGGLGDDLIYAGDGSDNASGGSGADRIDLGAGDDTAYGGSEDDIIYGGLGIDSAYGGTGADEIFGGEDDDWLFGGDGNDVLYGGNGLDRIYADDGDNLVYGGADADTILVVGDGLNGIYGGEDDDNITLGDERSLSTALQSNHVDGGSGHDLIHLLNGKTWALGGDGNDTFNFHVFSGEGDFTADGQAGTDHYNVVLQNGTLALQLDSFEARETLTISGDPFTGFTTLDTNNNGYLDALDSYVQLGGGWTTIAKDGLSVSIQHLGLIDADQIILA